MYSVEWFAGVIVGVLVGLILVMIFLKYTKTDKSIKCKFDERQVIDRGNAYKISFWVLVAYNGLYGLASMGLEKMPVDNFTALFIGIIVACLCQISYCIWKDAYFAVNEDKKKVMIAFAFIAIFNLVIGAMRIQDGSMIVDGVLTSNCINLVCGIMFLILFLVLLVKRCVNNMQSE